MMDELEFPGNSNKQKELEKEKAKQTDIPAATVVQNAPTATIVDKPKEKRSFSKWFTHTFFDDRPFKQVAKEAKENVVTKVIVPQIKSIGYNAAVSVAKDVFGPAGAQIVNGASTIISAVSPGVNYGAAYKNVTPIKQQASIPVTNHFDFSIYTFGTLEDANKMFEVLKGYFAEAPCLSVSYFLSLIGNGNKAYPTDTKYGWETLDGWAIMTRADGNGYFFHMPAPRPLQQY